MEVFFYVRSPEGHIFLQPRKFFFFWLSGHFFCTVWTPRTQKLQKKIFVSVCRLSVRCMCLASVRLMLECKICHWPSGHSFGPTSVSMWCLEIFEVDFWIFLFFQFIVGLGQFLRCNPDHFKILFLCFLWAKWTALRLFYKGYTVQKCVTFEITHFFYHFMELRQFFKVKFRPLSNRISMISVG